MHAMVDKENEKKDEENDGTRRIDRIYLDKTLLDISVEKVIDFCLHISSVPILLSNVF